MYEEMILEVNELQIREFVINEEKINREIISSEYRVHLEVMRNWFARMLLIERKKTVPEFQAVKTAIANCYKNINDSKKFQDVT